MKDTSTFAFGGLFAKKMACPEPAEGGCQFGKFIAAVNKNSRVPEFLETGEMHVAKTEMTISNAMDVGNPSNWARIMDLYDGDRSEIVKDIEAMTVSEEETKKTIHEVYEKYKYIADPHTAVGIAAAQKLSTNFPKIVLSTAHPAKFKESVEKEVATEVPIPEGLSAFLKKEKQSIFLEKNYNALQKTLRD